LETSLGGKRCTKKKSKISMSDKERRMKKKGKKNGFGGKVAQGVATAKGGS